MEFGSHFKWIIEKPRSTALVVSAAFLPYAITEFSGLLQRQATDEEVFGSLIGTASPFLTYVLTNFGITAISAFSYSEEKRPRTKLEHYYKRKKLVQNLKNKIPPFINRTATQANYSADTLFFEFLSLFRIFNDVFKRKVESTKNPLLLWRQASKELDEDNFDESFEYTKRAFQLSDGKLPNHAKILAGVYWSASYLMRTIYPAVPQAYVFSAAYAALTNPQKAWYYSELGRMVADEFDSPFRKEMYVCHALLASAQGRSDEEEAWSDAVKVSQEGAEWERLGESRSVVRVIKNGTFFRNTFLFKNKDTLEDALWEKECYETLGEIEGVTIPRVLYCSKTPEDGTHTLVMRVLAGETLYDKLQKGQQENVPNVITALANIHSTFPTEKLKPINLEDRIQKGVRALNLPDAISNAIVTNYSPVALALNSSAWAWNKDAHPENWIIGETIGVIDCESRNTAPVLCDVVNLLEYSNFFTQEQKREYIEQYIDEYNSKGKTLNKETAIRDYHNATIHRMICFASAWSDSTRPNLHAKRGAALEKGAAAISTLRKEHFEWYNSHKTKYEQLEQALNSAAKLMAAYTS